MDQKTKDRLTKEFNLDLPTAIKSVEWAFLAVLSNIVYGQKLLHEEFQELAKTIKQTKESQ